MHFASVLPSTPSTIRTSSNCLSKQGKSAINTRMCIPKICLSANWQPKVRPLWRPPVGGGWIVKVLPDSITDPEKSGLAPDKIERLVWGWKTRKIQDHGNHHSAINEVATFLRMNGLAVTKEVIGAIREHADREWCEREPSRCPQKPSPDAGKKIVLHEQRKQDLRPRGGCCGRSR